MNKIAITGHYNGIGKGLFDTLSKVNICKGFDLSNGYNITIDQDKILNESIDCDVFINNAYSGNAQVELLKKWHNFHFYRPYLAINVSSIGSMFLFAEEEEKYSNVVDMVKDLRYKTYIRNKFELNVVSQTINESKSMCKSTVIMPSSVDTNFAKSLNYEDTNQKKLNVNDVVQAIEYIISSKTAEKFISILAIEPR